MLQIAELPEPPYYAVIAPARLGPDVTGYPDTALRLMATAREIDGFLGIESCVRGDFALAVSYWRSLEAIEAWRRHVAHRHAKEQGMTRWFTAWATRIARVERAY